MRFSAKHFAISTQAMACVMLAMGLAGCGGGDGGSSSGGGGTPSPTPSQSPTPTPSAASRSNLVFVGKGNTGRIGLYAASTAAQGEKLLTPDFQSDGKIIDFAISPNGERAAFIGKPSALEPFALYVVSLAGGDLVRVSEEAGVDRNVSSFEWRPDSVTLAYDGNFGFSGSYLRTREVYTVKRDGTERKRVSVFLGSPPNVEVRSPHWSPNGGLLLMELAQLEGSPAVGKADAYRYDVYNPSLGGTPPITIVKYPSGDVRNAAFSPDNSKICFAGRKSQTVRYSLQYTKTSEGSDDGIVVTSSSGYGGRCEWSDNSNNMIYVEQADPNKPSILKSRNMTTALSNTVASLTQTGQSIKQFAYRPGDSSTIAFLGNPGSNLGGGYNVYTVKSTGQDLQRIGPAMSAGNNVLDFKWSDDGNTFAYRADYDDDTIIDLLTVKFADPENALHITLAPDHLLDYQFVPGTDRITFSGYQFHFDATRLLTSSTLKAETPINNISSGIENFQGFEVTAP